MLLGIGLSSLSLKLIGEATLPLKQSGVLPASSAISGGPGDGRSRRRCSHLIVHSSVAVLILSWFRRTGAVAGRGRPAADSRANLGSG